MNIKIIAVGKIKENYFQNKIEEFTEKIGKKNKIRLIELMDESIPKKAGDNLWEEIKLREGKRILEQISKEDYVVALCIEGKETDEKIFRKICDRAKDLEKESVTFVIGGSLGLHPLVTERADYKMSFSKMTFPHQLMRVMLLEQIHKWI